jgi:hypothetical protein
MLQVPDCGDIVDACIAKCSDKIVVYDCRWTEDPRDLSGDKIIGSPLYYYLNGDFENHNVDPNYILRFEESLRNFCECVYGHRDIEYYHGVMDDMLQQYRFNYPARSGIWAAVDVYLLLSNMGFKLVSAENLK